MENIVIIVLAIIALVFIIKVLPYKIAYWLGRLCGSQGLAGDIANIIWWALRHAWIVVAIILINYVKNLY